MFLHIIDVTRENYDLFLHSTPVGSFNFVISFHGLEIQLIHVEKRSVSVHHKKMISMINFK